MVVVSRGGIKRKGKRSIQPGPGKIVGRKKIDSPLTEKIAFFPNRTSFVAVRS